MKKAHFFRGMMPIMPTAIHESGEIDERSQRRLVNYCIENGAVAIGHFGFASEFHKLTEGQRAKLTRIIVDEVAGRVPVFIGVTSPSVLGSAENAKKAADAGADIIMAMLPYIEVPDSNGALRFYETLSNATPLPIVIQDAGHSSGILTASLLIKMFREIEHVFYVKSEGKDFLTKTHTLVKEVGEEMQIIGGAAGKHMFHMLRIGVTAFMTGTEVLDLHASVVSAFLAGREDDSFRIYADQVLPYLMFYMDYGVELLKFMLHRRGIISSSKLIPPEPSPRISPIETEEFLYVLDRIGFPKLK